MGSWSRVRALALKVPRWAVLLAGLWALARSALRAMGGYDRLWLFGKMEQSRYTAMAILTGTLRLRNGVAHLWHDEQAYNGAGYTNWGFGVPLLEVPFHAVAARMAKYPSKFFPDRAIYFFYLLLLLPVLWAAFDRLLAIRETAGVAIRVRRHLLSWSATLFVLTCVLYPLMSGRFLIYEETLSYLGIFELLALSAYIFALPSWGSVASCLIGVAAGVGLLIRPTGLICLGVWAMLVLLESKSRRAVAAFAAGTAPFFAFWFYSNWVRTGSPWGFGYANAMPGYPYHTPMMRFGCPCANTWKHTFEAAGQLFRGLFLTINDDPGPLPRLPSAPPMPVAPPAPESWLKKCHFDWETRPPSAQSYAWEPFLGLGVLVLLTWVLSHYLTRRERRLSVYVPFVALAFMFANYARSLPGFAWRYVGDFWPLIVLVCVQYVRWLPRSANRVLGLPLAAVFAVSSHARYVSNIEPALNTLEMIDPHDPAAKPTAMWDDFTNSRYSMDPPLPSRYACGDRLTWPYHNGVGWNSGSSGCGVDTYSNLFLGVPPKRTDHYELRFATKGVSAKTLRVYVNGRLYTAKQAGNAYVAPAEIHYASLTSPIVMVAIEWTSDLDATPGEELLSIELL